LPADLITMTSRRDVPCTVCGEWLVTVIVTACPSQRDAVEASACTGLYASNAIGVDITKAKTRAVERPMTNSLNPNPAPCRYRCHRSYRRSGYGGFNI